MRVRAEDQESAFILAQERNVALVSDSPTRPASYTGDGVGCGRSEVAIQRRCRLDMEGALLLIYILVQLGRIPGYLSLALRSS